MWGCTRAWPKEQNGCQSADSRATTNPHRFRDDDDDDDEDDDDGIFIFSRSTFLLGKIT